MDNHEYNLLINRLLIVDSQWSDFEQKWTINVFKTNPVDNPDLIHYPYTNYPPGFTQPSYQLIQEVKLDLSTLSTPTIITPTMLN